MSCTRLYFEIIFAAYNTTWSSSSSVITYNLPHPVSNRQKHNITPQRTLFLYFILRSLHLILFYIYCNVIILIRNIQQEFVYFSENQHSTSNQNSTPFSWFMTPYACPILSMIAFTMERPIPVPPYSLVLALSTL